MGTKATARLQPDLGHGGNRGTQSKKVAQVEMSRGFGGGRRKHGLTGVVLAWLEEARMAAVAGAASEGFPPEL